MVLVLDGCSAEGERGEAGQSRIEARLQRETVRRLLRDIRTWKQQGRNVREDCRTLRTQFYKTLKRSPLSEDRQVASELSETCQDVLSRRSP